MSYAAPIHMGQLGPVVDSDIVDFYLDIAADLGTGEAISSVTFAGTGSDGVGGAGVGGDHPGTTGRADGRVTAPGAGEYTLTAVFTIDDGQKLTRTATLIVV